MKGSFTHPYFDRYSNLVWIKVCQLINNDLSSAAFATGDFYLNLRMEYFIRCSIWKVQIYEFR